MFIFNSISCKLLTKLLFTIDHILLLRAWLAAHINIVDANVFSVVLCFGYVYYALAMLQGRVFIEILLVDVYFEKFSLYIFHLKMFFKYFWNLFLEMELCSLL